MSSRRLQDMYHNVCKACPQNVLKTSSMEQFLQKVVKLNNCCGEYVLKTSLRHFLKTSSRRLEVQQMFDGILIYCSPRLSNAVFMNINCNIYPAVLSIISYSICSFILTAIAHLLIQAGIFHLAREIVNILIIANSTKLN